MANNKGSQMVLPPPVQVGIIVRNLKETMDFYFKAFGIGPFQVLDLDIKENWVKGKNTPIRVKAGLCQWGSIQLELIEPVKGNSPHKMFLEEKGEGMHHLLFMVDNLDKWLNYLKDHKMEVILHCKFELEGSKVHLVYIESNRGLILELAEIPQKNEK